MSTDTRLEDLGSHLQVMHAHHRRLAALVTKAGRQHPPSPARTEAEVEGGVDPTSPGSSSSSSATLWLNQSDFHEMEGEAMLVTQMMYSIAERYLAIAPPPSITAGRGGGSSRVVPCAFSETERRSDPDFRKLSQRYSTLREAAEKTLEKSSLVGILPDTGADTSKQKSRPQAGPTNPVRRRPQKRGTSTTSAEPGRDEDYSNEQMMAQLAAREEDVDALIAQHKKEEALAIAKEVEELRKLQQEMNTLVAEHQQGVDRIEGAAEDTAETVERGRDQLVKASHLQAAGAWIGGAVVGGLVAGPVGMLAGAKSAGLIVGVAAAGSLTGGVITSSASKAIVRNNAEFQEVPAEEPSATAATTEQDHEPLADNNRPTE